MDEFAGVIAMETSDGALTVKTVDPLTDPELALMLVDPMDFAVATPAELMDAVAVDEELQATLLVRFWVVPLL